MGQNPPPPHPDPLLIKKMKVNEIPLVNTLQSFAISAFTNFLANTSLVSYAAVVWLITQHMWGGALCDKSENGCLGDKYDPLLPSR